MKREIFTNLELPDDDLWGVSYKDRVPNELKYYLDKLLSSDRTRTPELVRAKATVQSFNPAQRTCPVCGGAQFDLTTLINLSIVLDGMQLNSMLNDRDNYGSMTPIKWECSKCGAFDISKPNLKQTSSRPLGKTSFGYALMKFNPMVEEVHTITTSYLRGWVLRIEEEWYFLSGIRERAEVAIGMKELDLALNQKRGEEWLKMRAKERKPTDN